jgi:hypothetical protein
MADVYRTTYDQVILADNPSNYWRLNEASGLTAVDSVGGANGTISGGVTLNQPGVLVDGGKAMAFDGTGKIQTATPLTVPVTTTIEFWMKALGNSAAFTVTLDEIDQLGAIGIRQNDGNGILQISVDYKAGSPFFGGRFVFDNKWHHVVVTMNGVTVSLYVDGVLDTSAAIANVAVTSKVTLGTSGRAQPVAYWLNGLLDEVALYAVALTPAQVLAHYQAARLNPYDPRAVVPTYTQPVAYPAVTSRRTPQAPTLPTPHASPAPVPTAPAPATPMPRASLAGIIDAGRHLRLPTTWWPISICSVSPPTPTMNAVNQDGQTSGPGVTFTGVDVETAQ